MACLKFFAIYFLIELVISSYWFVSAKIVTRRNTDKQGTVVEYDLQKQLADDSLLTTGPESKLNKDLLDEITDSGVIDMEKYRQKYTSSSSMEPKNEWTERYLKHKGNFGRQRFQHKGNWKGKNMDINDSLKNVNRESREEDDVDDDDHIKSKDEEDDEDVQLIIIPKKTRKHFHTKVQNDENDDEEEDANSESRNSENSRHGSENSVHASRGRHKTSEDGDVSIEMSDVQKEEDGEENEKNGGDYDLHVKVKDNSGTKVKLTGDLPGNIGNLVAEGEKGGKIQLENTKNKDDEKLTSEDELNNKGETTADTTDDVAQTLIKIKSGKLKHSSPYPSTVLLNPSQSQDEITNNEVDAIPSDNPEKIDGSQEMSKGSDKYSSKDVSKTVSQDSGGGDKEQTDKQTNNVFSPMEFENGDDELVATSRLLDIARKADDETSLKEEKDSSNSKSSSSVISSSSDNSLTGKQRSIAISKLPKLESGNYKKQSDDLDEEYSVNWYKLQSLEDQIIKEGNSAKPGKTMGSYNGQEVSVASPGQLELLQTEYPSYPAYLTALQRTKIMNN